MLERNWGQIPSGATFESLATTLIFFEDAGAALFGRRGKDGGQDARSGDGRRVFQAKHHQDGAASKAIADAKKEASKIAKYREPGHSREPQWRGVTDWHLVTNAAFNPTDKATWDSDVVPLFNALGLNADYWEQANLNALLDKHPEVDRAYFQNQTRAFLSLPEVNETLPIQEPFLRRDALGAFVGRDAEIQDIRSFLDSEKLFLVIHGPGGVGKTRLVLEAGERVAADGHWTVLWGNVASMEASGSWFDAIVPERPTLLIVDEPEGDRILQVLAEQLGTKLGRASQWKIAITVRSPKDPVLKFLFGPRMKPRLDQLCVAALTQADAERMCAELIDDGVLSNAPGEWRASTSKELSRRFASHPVWLTLAVHLLETTGDLTKVPETADGLAEQYLSEVAERQSSHSPETVLTLLRWVALVGTLNRENDTTIDLVASQAKLGSAAAARAALASLVRRRALAERGARNRFVEVKPDVLRDHLLLKWLSTDLGYGSAPIQPSDAAKALAEQLLRESLDGSLSAVGRAILTSLARTELILGLSGHTVPLLGPYMEAVRVGVGTATASTRVALADSFVDIAAYRPDDTVALSKVLRSSPCPTESIDGIFGPREVGQDDVLFALAWPVFHAAFGARTGDQRRLVLGELCELAEAESAASVRRPRGLPNDGKRAKELIGRTLEGEPQFWSDFEDAAFDVANRLLDEAANVAPTSARVDLLWALLTPATSLERRQIWSDRFTVHIQTLTLLPDHPGGQTRLKLKGKVMEILKNVQTPRCTRLALWPIFTKTHRSVNQVLRKAHSRVKGLLRKGKILENVQTPRCTRLALSPNFAETHRSVNRFWWGSSQVLDLLREEMLDDLTWAHSVLTARSSDLDELSAARDLWNWHARFEKDAALRPAADALEALYSGNELAAEFELLLGRDDWRTRGPRAVKKARELAEAGVDAIDEFLTRSRAFFRDEQQIHQVFHVAWYLGLIADTAEGVRAFVLDALGSALVSPRSDFAAIAAAGWAAARRKKAPQSAHGLVTDLVGSCASDGQVVNLLTRLYGQIPRREDAGELSPEEFRFVRSHHMVFLRTDRAPSYIACVGWGVGFEWPELRAIVEQVLDQAPVNQTAGAIGILVDAVFRALHDEANGPVPADIGSWLLNQLLRVPDLDSLGGNPEWQIQEIIKRAGRVSLEWLQGALALRQELEAQEGHKDFRAISHRVRLSGYAAPIPPEGEVSQADANAVRSLLDFAHDTGSVGYYLHEILRDVDPNGRVVPGEVARLISSATAADEARRLARIGGAFSIGSPAWRTIAQPALVRAARAEPDECRSLFSALMDHGVRSWSGTPGEVPKIFIEAVESARHRLKAETDQVFVSFWQWRLDVAEAELGDQEAQAKEERGE